MAKKKSSQERRIEHITWALLLWALAVAFALNLPTWLLPLVSGVILLLSAAYQGSRGWRVSPLTWIAGVVLMLIGLGEPLGALQVEFLPVALLIVATIILMAIIGRET